MRYFNVTGNKPCGGHDAFRKFRSEYNNGIGAYVYGLNIHVYCFETMLRHLERDINKKCPWKIIKASGIG